MAREYITTPVGILVYGVLSEPSTEYKPAGEFLAKVRFREEDLGAIKQAYKANINEAKEMAIKSLSKDGRVKKHAEPKRGDVPWRADVENPGWYVVNFKKAASGTKDGREWTAVLPMYRANGSPIEGEQKGIWSGSEVSVAFFPVPYFQTNQVGYGVALKLGALQVLKAQYGSAQTASAFGFSTTGDQDDSDSSDSDDSDPDGAYDSGDTYDSDEFDADPGEASGDFDDDIPF